jgi:subtilisin family serine protease
MRRARRSFEVGPGEVINLLDKRGGRVVLARLNSGFLAHVARSSGGPAPVAFEDVASGLLRVLHREMVIRFQSSVPERRRRAILGWFGFAVRRRNVFIPDQVVVCHPGGKYGGEELIEVSNLLTALDEIALATPNFISQYRRQILPSILPQEWHLGSTGLDVLEAWKVTTGSRKIVVAVLDDGVDVDHPNLKANVWRNPDLKARDQIGRDFFLSDDHPDHFNPRPKRFQFPFDRMKGNDIHGTACAGLIAASGVGKGSVGVAPGCRLLPVKIFHGDHLAPDERVADAIRYAAIHADLLSCSWEGGSGDVQKALEDAGAGRKGLGSAVFCAAGNGFSAPVGFPARAPHAIAVGAVTDLAERADYANIGPEIAVTAPSDGGVNAIFTTDVSLPGRGFNLGTEEQGGTDGLHTNAFGGTSAATALAAGVGALVLSANPALTREELKDLLKATADKMGRSFDVRGHSDELGYGRINAGNAVQEALRRGQRG